MAELNAPIIAKASATTGEVPLASDLEVAEIAVNTADGKLFTKHTDDSIKEISGSGGGAVNSVNGETGVVSLGVQDMDDFEVNSVIGTYTWPNKDNNGNSSANRECPDPGDWASFRSTGLTCFYLHKDSTAEQLVVGETVTLTIDTGDTYTGVISSNTTSLTDTWAMCFSDDAAQDPILNASLGTSLTIVSTALGTVPVPLADGDILQWDNADQKFKPAQLSAAPVDSVNGETGVVSLGIQEMDDYKKPTVYHYERTNSNSPPSGQFTTNGYAGREVLTLSYDLNGKNPGVDGWTSLTAGDPVWWKSDTVTSWQETTLYSNPQSSPLAFSIVEPPEFDAGPGDGGGELYLAFEAPELQEGHILQWSDADQKFKPAHLSAAPVDSVNGETGVVSLGIDDMNDCSVTGTSVTTDLGEWTQNVGGIFPSQDGKWRNFDASGYDIWQLYKEDVLGDDYSSELLALVTGDVIQVSTDSGSTYNIAVTLTADPAFSTGGGGDTVVNLLLSDADGAKLTGLSGISLRITQPGLAVPLVGGDILQWANAEQKFKPAQLPDVINKATLQTEVAASTDFADFKSRIAAL